MEILTQLNGYSDKCLFLVFWTGTLLDPSPLDTHTHFWAGTLLDPSPMEKWSLDMNTDWLIGWSRCFVLGNDKLEQVFSGTDYVYNILLHIYRPTYNQGWGNPNQVWERNHSNMWNELFQVHSRILLGYIGGFPELLFSISTSEYNRICVP